MTRTEPVRTVGGLRRRMPRHLLSAFCLSLLLLGCACGAAYTADDEPEHSVPLFATGTTKVPANSGDEKPRRDFSSFASPLLVGGNGVMVALAEARYTGGDEGEENVDIVARYIETEGPNWINKTTDNSEDDWKTQLVLQGKEEVGQSVLRSPTAVVKSDKIYLLALHNRMHGSSQSGNGWHFELSVGVITGEVGSKTIEWNSSRLLHSKLTQEVEKQRLSVSPGNGRSAFLTSKGTIVFSVKATNRENTSGFAVMQLKDDEEQWEVSFVEKPRECMDVSFFEWREKIVRLFSDCSKKSYIFGEYDEGEKQWMSNKRVPLGSMNSSLWVRDFIHVTIEGKTVLLFTEEVNADGEQRGIRLWMTSVRRAYNVGLIFTHYYGNTSGGLLYTNGGLFFLHPQGNEAPGALILTRLDRQLEIIKLRLRTWGEADRQLTMPPFPPGEPMPSTYTKETLETTADPKKDSSEFVRMGLGLMFLLGLRAFALFFSAPI